LLRRDLEQARVATQTFNDAVRATTLAGTEIIKQTSR